MKNNIEPIEDIGTETLKLMEKLDHYNHWIYNRISPWVGNRVLEVGSGIGNFSKYFLDRTGLILSDSNPEYLDILRDRYSEHPNVSFTEYDLEYNCPHLRGRGIDTIICLNVLEHVKDDRFALSEMSRLLIPGGRIILQLPAHPVLYGSLDSNLEHMRRYTLSDICNKFIDAGLCMETYFRMNFFGAAGWFVCSRVFKRKLLPKGMLGIFDFMVPVFRGIEDMIPVPAGLSIVVIGIKGQGLPLLDCRIHPVPV